MSSRVPPVCASNGSTDIARGIITLEEDAEIIRQSGLDVNRIMFARYLYTTYRMSDRIQKGRISGVKRSADQ